MKQRLSGVLLMIAASSLVQAHFVFVVPEAGGAIARVFISETLSPDAAAGAQLISGARLTLRSADGIETPLSLVRTGDTFTVALAGQGNRVIHGIADLGLSNN